MERLCRAALAAARPAGLTSVCASRLIDDRPRGVVWASDPRARRIDDLQVVLGEGPGITAITEGGPVLVPDLRGQWRQGWVTFERAAVELGVRSICAFPLQIGAVRLGVLTLHGTEPASLDAAQLSEELAVCDDLSVALLVADAGSGDWSSVLDGALDPPLAITSQAAGMVMVQLGSTIAEAMARLSAHAFGAGLSLEEVSRAVVERTLRFQPDRFYPETDPDDPQPLARN
ncbi:MAG TPA: GAF and ANTAR domain-containing protein [Propionicimonas sp.]|uniref:GAF and ANTAR domain-containing protein n=1 Tax=Propionicimonas sp. TaxID=1955623 RepID=UPI002F3F38AF